VKNFIYRIVHISCYFLRSWTPKDTHTQSSFTYRQEHVLNEHLVLCSSQYILCSNTFERHTPKGITSTILSLNASLKCALILLFLNPIPVRRYGRHVCCDKTRISQKALQFVLFRMLLLIRWNTPCLLINSPNVSNKQNLDVTCQGRQP
jgi:hypothetical protein